MRGTCENLTYVYGDISWGDPKNVILHVFLKDLAEGLSERELASSIASNNIADVQGRFKTARSMLLDWV